MKLSAPAFFVVLAVIALLLAAAFARAESPQTTRLEWDPNPASDGVLAYLIQHRPRGSNATNQVAWTTVTVGATPAPAAEIPVDPYATEFRFAGSNAFGLGAWTAIFYLPSTTRGIRIVLPLSP